MVASVGIRLSIQDAEKVRSVLRGLGDAGDTEAGRIAGGFDKAGRSSTYFEGKANALRATLDPLWAAQQRANRATADAQLLLDKGKISAELFAQANARVAAELDEVTRSLSRTNQQSGASRAGLQQLGFQAQDFAVQIAGGTSAVRALSLQLPQAIGALQLMTLHAGESGGKLGQLASFLNNGWGVALGVAIPLAGMFIEKLLGTGSAADKAKAANIDFSNSLVANAGLVSNYAESLDQLQRAAQGLINTQALLLDNTKVFADKSVEQLQGDLDRIDGQITAKRGDWIDRLGGGTVLNSLIGERAKVQAQLDSARKSLADAETALEARRATEGANPSTAALAQIERDKARLMERRRQTLEAGDGVPFQDSALQPISEDEFAKAIAQIEKRKDAVAKAASAASAAAAQARSDAKAAARDDAAHLKALLEMAGADVSKLGLQNRKTGAIDPDGKGDLDKKISAMLEGRQDAAEASRQNSLFAQSKALERIAEQQAGENALLDVRFQLLGKNGVLEAQALDRERLILELRKQGIDIDSDEAKRRLAANDALAARTAIYDEHKSRLMEVQQLGERFVDTVLSPDTWSSWGNAGKTILRELKADFLQLALLNPVKNLLGLNGGKSLQTLSGVFQTLLGGNAIGTEAWAGGPSWVGEHGKELVDLPRGSKVYTAAESRRMAGAGASPPVFHIYADNVVTLEQIWAMIQQGMAGAAVRGAAGGSAMAQQEMASRGRRQLGRRW